MNEPGNVLPTTPATDAATATAELDRRMRDPARPKIHEEGYRAWVERDAELRQKVHGTAETGTTAAAASPTEAPSPATERAAMDARAHGLDRPFPGEAHSEENAALGKDARGLAFTLGQSRETTTRWVSEFERGLARQETISDLDAAQERDRCERELRGRWGDGYTANVRLLTEVLGHYPRLRDAINESGLGRNAAFLQELFTAAHREKVQRESEAIFKKHGRRPASDAEGA